MVQFRSISFNFGRKNCISRESKCFSRNTFRSDIETFVPLNKIENTPTFCSIQGKNRKNVPNVFLSLKNFYPFVLKPHSFHSSVQISPDFSRKSQKSANIFKQYLHHSEFLPFLSYQPSFIPRPCSHVKLLPQRHFSKSILTQPTKYDVMLEHMRSEV